MELSNDMLIDLALNIAGFAAAGGLVLVIYSIATHRRRASRASVELAAPGSSPVTDRTPARPDTAESMFIDLSTSAETRSDNGVPGRRRRAEVLQLAREMLANGTSSEAIRADLPVSEAELALLRRGATAPAKGK